MGSESDAVNGAPLASKSFKETMEKNIVWWSLGLLVMGFIAGIGAFKGLLEITDQTTVVKGRFLSLEDVERKYALRSESVPTSRLEKDYIRRSELKSQYVLRDKLSAEYIPKADYQSLLNQVEGLRASLKDAVPKTEYQRVVSALKVFEDEKARAPFHETRVLGGGESWVIQAFPFSLAYEYLYSGGGISIKLHLPDSNEEDLNGVQPGKVWDFDANAKRYKLTFDRLEPTSFDHEHKPLTGTVQFSIEEVK
jgi:hypothetical protein